MPPPTVDDSAERMKREQAERDRAERERLERERAAAAKAEADRRAEEARKAEEAERARLAQEAERARLEQERLARERIDWFVAGFFGKERRVREIETNVSDGRGGFLTTETGQCAPLVGAKVGADIRLSPEWRMAPAVGVAFNTDESDDTSLFAEVEFNRVFERSFVGTGIGVWDFTHSDTVAATWLIHAGREIYRQANENRLFLVAEGRLFLNDIDDTANNYQFWGGLRYVIR